MPINRIIKIIDKNALSRSMKSSYDTTDTLRGLAILAVLFNHYLTTYFTKSYLFTGFANAVVAIFFILSGYGMCASFSRRMQQTPPFSTLLCQVYIERLIKIFPLFLLALLVQSVITGTEYPLWAYLGIRADGHFWFINAIIHCYFTAPFLFFGLQKIKSPIIFLCMVSGMVIIINTAVFVTDELLTQNVFLTLFKWKLVYRGYIFMHILLFCSGMCLYEVQKEKSLTVLKSFFCNNSPLVTFMLIILFLFLWKIGPTGWAQRILNICYLVTCVCFCAQVIARSLVLKPLNLFGKYAYSLYLFHMSYFFILHENGLISRKPIFNTLVLLIVFPLFYLLCRFLENTTNRFGAILKSRILKQ